MTAVAYYLAYFAGILGLFGALRFWNAHDQVRDAVQKTLVTPDRVEGIRREFKAADRKVAWGAGLTVLSGLLIFAALIVRAAS